MAAHIFTMLKDFANGNNTVEMIKFGIGHAQAGDQLDFNDWEKFNNAPDIESVKKIANALLPKYENIWEFLGEPKTAEDWNDEVYKLKTSRRNQYRKLLWLEVSI